MLEHKRQEHTVFTALSVSCLSFGVMFTQSTTGSCCLFSGYNTDYDLGVLIKDNMVVQGFELKIN